jgi:hypothetical protein
MRFIVNLRIFLIFSIIFISQTNSFSTTPFDGNRLYGVTIDDISGLNAIVTSLHNLCRRPTVRIVFDEWQPATNYTQAVNNIHNVSFIMGEILDSYYMHLYSYQQYHDRVNEYLNSFGSKVDIWEVGNEVNGEWCGNIDSVVAKIHMAYQIIKGQGKTTELTLYYNYQCWSNPQNEMFRWVQNRLPSDMKNGLDYVLVSYYEDDCNNYQPNWQRVFDSLHVLFPNSKIGMGECGTSHASLKASYMTRYYTMHITTPRYVGGYFWWYYTEDCVPYTKTLWGVLNTAINSSDEVETQKNNIVTYNYPNPFNPSTQINYFLPGEGQVSLIVYDVSGRQVKTLVNEFQLPGNHSIDFDGSSLASGVYIYRLSKSDMVEVRKMVLVK